MKAVISSTYDDQYLFYLPITIWLWNKLGVDVICFMPYKDISGKKFMLVSDILTKMPNNSGNNWIYSFDCPEHKEATYAQCSRLYASCLDLPEDEILITSDIDMAIFNLFEYNTECNTKLSIFGADLVPTQQYPMCYISAKVKDWRDAFNLHDITYQQALDNILADIECENMRGNYWGKDQEEAYKNIVQSDFVNTINRAKPNTQFASNRIDRDDAYFMDRLSPDIIDYHMHRPGYTDENFEKIVSVIQYFYPNDDLTWMRRYQEKYKELL